MRNEATPVLFSRLLQFSFWALRLSVNIPFVLPGMSPAPLLGISQVIHVLQSKAMLLLANLRCNYIQSDVYVKIVASV